MAETTAQRRRTARVALLVLSALLTAGCAEPPGRVEVTFDWIDPPARALWLWAHVRASDAERGERRATAGPVAYTPGEPWMLELPDVPNGAGWVIVVEARARRELDERVLYYGVSAPFAMAPGRRASVRVELALDVPRVSTNPGLELLFDGEARGVVDRATIERATLRFGAVAADSMIVANDPTLTQGAARVELGADPRVRCADPERTRCIFGPWDARAGAPARGDGVYPVFMKLIDRAGYSSAVQTASVFLDSTAPELSLPAPSIQADDGRSATDEILAVRPTVGVDVAFTVTEPLATAEVTAGGRGADAVRLSADGRTVFARFEPLALAPGRSQLWAEVSDVAGNPASFAVGWLERDDTPPEGLRPSNQAAVRLVVAPTGSAALDGALALRVCSVGEWSWCPPGRAFPATSRVEVYPARPGRDGGIECDARPLGPPLPAAGDLPLVCNCAAVCLAEVDPAGNRSPPEVVEAVEWWSIPGEVLPLGGFSAPMRHAIHRVVDHRPVDAATISSAQSVAAIADGHTTAVRGAARWQAISSSRPPLPARGGAVAFDAARGEVVHFGGWRAGPPPTRVAETWLWDGERLRAAQPSPDGDQPTALSEAAAAYDRRRTEVVLFGGRDDGRRRGDTWSWDGARWHLRATLGAPGPTPRAGHAMAYDPSSDRILLFGGDVARPGDPDGLAADLWAWDGVGWTRLTDSLAGPPARADAGLAADPLGGGIVLFGGRGADGALLDDTWRFDGEAWRPIDGPRPPTRRRPALLEARDAGRVVLLGGDGVDGPLFDRWTLEPDGWRPAPVPAVEPDEGPPMITPAVYAPATGEAIALGVDPLATAWHLGADGWTPRGPSAPEGTIGGPSHRVDFALAGVPDSHITLLVGGRDPERGYLADTWAWDGRVWHAYPGCEPACEGLTPRAGHALLTGPSQAPLLFGGQDGRTLLGDLWRWQDDRWQRVALESPVAPGPRWGHAWVHDPVLDRGVLFGGWSPADGALWSPADWSATTWIWQGHRWRALDLAGPAPRMGHGMAAVASGVVLWGGLDADAEPQATLWTLDGVGWRRRAFEAGGEAPPARWDSALIADRAGRPTLFVGPNQVTPWTWDGERWSIRDAIGEPPTLDPADRVAAATVFADPFRRLAAAREPSTGQTLVALGTAGPTVALWRWSDGADTHPAHTLRATFDHPTLSGATLNGLTARLHAGGVSLAGAGARLALWDGQVWTPAAAHDASDEAPAELVWTAESPEVARALLRGRDAGIALLVAPLGANGDDEAVIALDAARIETVWRLRVAR